MWLPIHEDPPWFQCKHGTDIWGITVHVTFRSHLCSNEYTTHTESYDKHWIYQILDVDSVFYWGKGRQVVIHQMRANIFRFIPNVIPQTHINISCTNTDRTWGKPWLMSKITVVTWLPSSSRSWLNTASPYLCLFPLYCLPVGLHYPIFTASKFVE